MNASTSNANFVWAKVFAALMWRDVLVTARELPYFLMRTTLQPLMFVTVFGFLLPRLGFVEPRYAAALFPGMVAITLAFASLQAVALPMVSDLGPSFTIEDRLLAPVPIEVLAAARVCAGVIEGAASVAFLLPVGRLIVGPLDDVSLSNSAGFSAFVLLSATTFSCFGLILGTVVRAEHVSTMFGVLIAPMIFFGCTYFTWASLAAFPVIKYLVLMNPLVYVAEGMRGILSPSLAHMSMGWVLSALGILTPTFFYVGVSCFRRRCLS